MTTPTKEELSNVKLAVEKLWELDENRLEPGTDYSLNLVLARRRNDNTEKKLFEFVDRKVSSLPTYKYFYQLLDNYIPETGIPEQVDDHELEENQAFIRECLKTSPIKYVYNYLVAKDVFKGDISKFADELLKTWFGLYKREGADDSSAFEHVFVGEVRDGKAKAFHNWITFYFYEKSGKIDYEGFVTNKKKKNEEPDPNSHVISIRFTFEGAKKPFSTSFIGTSPEFELAMYTLLFYLKREDTQVTLDEVDLNIKIYDYHVKGGDGTRYLGSAFPMIVNQ